MINLSKLLACSLFSLTFVAFGMKKPPKIEIPGPQDHDNMDMSDAGAGGGPEAHKAAFARAIEEAQELSQQLVRAAKKGDHESAGELLLIKGANPNTMDPSGSTPLAIAVQRKYPHVVEALLASPIVDIDSQDNQGNSPLMLAVIGFDKTASGWFNEDAKASYKKIIKMLLKEEVDLKMSNATGQTAFDLTDDPEILELLNIAAQEQAVIPKRKRRVKFSKAF